MARSYYVKQVVIASVPLPRGEELRVTVGTQQNGKQYLDIRIWYPDEDGGMSPGKGVGKPLANIEWEKIGQAIIKAKEDYESGSDS